IVFDLWGRRTLDPSQRVLSLVELIPLEVDPRESERSLISHGFIDGTLEHPLDRASGALVHAVVQFEVADRKLGVADVIVESIECGLVDSSMQRDLGIEPLECIEILSLVGAIERLSEIEIFQVGQVGGRDWMN